MSAPLTARQALLDRLDDMNNSANTTAATAQGMLNAGIVFSVAMSAMAMGVTAALLAPLVRKPQR